MSKDKLFLDKQLNSGTYRMFKILRVQIIRSEDMFRSLIYLSTSDSIYISNSYLVL